MATGFLHDSNINRSPYSYDQDPPAEKARYEYNTDHALSRIEEADSGEPIGLISWFAVHGTSMNNQNQLISGDNKGLAMQLFEKLMNGNMTRPGQGRFVASFSQANAGDVSPTQRDRTVPTAARVITSQFNRPPHLSSTLYLIIAVLSLLLTQNIDLSPQQHHRNLYCHRSGSERVRIDVYHCHESGRTCVVGMEQC